MPMPMNELRRRIWEIAYSVDDHNFGVMKKSFLKAIELPDDLNIFTFVDDAAEVVVNRGIKTPEQVLAIAMLVFQK